MKWIWFQITPASNRRGRVRRRMSARRKPAWRRQVQIQRQAQVPYWYDPMHPTYKADKPGIAPDCGMEWSKYADETGGQRWRPAPST